MFCDAFSRRGAPFRRRGGARRVRRSSRWRVGLSAKSVSSAGHGNPPPREGRGGAALFSARKSNKEQLHDCSVDRRERTCHFHEQDGRPGKARQVQAYVSSLPSMARTFSSLGSDPVRHHVRARRRSCGIRRRRHPLRLGPHSASSSRGVRPRGRQGARRRHRLERPQDGRPAQKSRTQALEAPGAGPGVHVQRPAVRTRGLVARGPGQRRCPRGSSVRAPPPTAVGPHIVNRCRESAPVSVPAGFPHIGADGRPPRRLRVRRQGVVRPGPVRVRPAAVQRSRARRRLGRPGPTSPTSPDSAASARPSPPVPDPAALA